MNNSYNYNDKRNYINYFPCTSSSFVSSNQFFPSICPTSTIIIDNDLIINNVNNQQIPRHDSNPGFVDKLSVEDIAIS